MAYPSDPMTADPVFATDIGSQKLVRFLYTTLFRMGEDGSILPELAVSYTWSRNDKGTQIQIQIDTERRLPDGRAWTPQFVKNSLDRLKKTKGPRQSAFQWILDVRILNSKTIEILADGGLRGILTSLSLPNASVYPMDLLEKGSGEYLLEQWRHNDRIVLARNPFQMNRELPDSILIRILPEASTAAFLFSRGKLDVFRVPENLLSYPGLKKGVLLQKKGRNVQYVAFHYGKKCLDKNFRLALNYAIPRDLIIQKLLEGNGIPSVVSVPKSYLSPDVGSEFDYSRDNAMEYLKLSECFPAISDTVLDLRMRGIRENQAMGATIAEYLKNIGLKVRLQPMEKASLYKENGEGKGDLTLLTWQADIPSPWNYIDPLFSAERFGNGGNRSYYHSEKMERILQKYRDSDSLENRELLLEAISILKEDPPWIFLWSSPENYVLSKRATAYSSLARYW